MAAKNSRRKRTPIDIETAVLANSGRRCTLCFYLSGDLAEKLGQIAHLDQDPSNRAEDNLAFMCLAHHSLYDSKTSQHKNYTMDEVKAARSRLYTAVAAGKHLSPVAAQPNSETHGAQSPINTALGNITQHFYAGAAPPLETQPHVSLRIQSVSADLEHDIQYRPITLKTIGDDVLVNVNSIATVVFSALNSNECPTSLDYHSLEITVPPGQALACKDITHANIVWDTRLPGPLGVLRLEPNAPLKHGITLKRFVRFLVTETVRMRDPKPDGGFQMPSAFEALVRKARQEAGAYEAIGTFRLQIVDSYGGCPGRS